MCPQKRTYTTRQAKRTSRQMREGAVGTHVNQGAHAQGAPKNASSIAFSNKRGRDRARKGEVSNLMPRTTSSESDRVYQRRTRQRHRAVKRQRRISFRRILIGVVIAAVLVAIALFAGTLAFRGTVGSSFALRDSDASQALVAAKDGQPSYTLIATDLGSVAASLDEVGPDVILLVRADEASGKVALVEIPQTLQVSLGDTGTHNLSEAASDAVLIDAVSKLANVSISHYVKLGEQDLVNLVDALGGVEVELSQVVDDPRAGDVYLPIGTHTLNGHSALTYLRTQNLKQGSQDQRDNQLDFAARLIAALFSAENGGFDSRIEAVGPCLQTDYSLADLTALSKWVSAVPASSMTKARTPGYTTATSGVVETEKPYFVATADGVKGVVEALEEGRDPSADATADAGAVSPSSFTIEVQNGTEIAGAAQVTGDLLTSKGFTVKNVGNAEQQIYDETLVVYKGDEGEARAKAVIEALGNGRAVSAGYYYDFKTDILVILGADFKPTT